MNKNARAAMDIWTEKQNTETIIVKNGSKRDENDN